MGVCLGYFSLEAPGTSCMDDFQNYKRDLAVELISEVGNLVRTVAAERGCQAGEALEFFPDSDGPTWRPYLSALPKHNSFPSWPRR